MVATEVLNRHRYRTYGRSEAETPKISSGHRQDQDDKVCLYASGGRVYSSCVGVDVITFRFSNKIITLNSVIVDRARPCPQVARWRLKRPTLRPSVHLPLCMTWCRCSMVLHSGCRSSRQEQHGPFGWTYLRVALSGIRAGATIRPSEISSHARCKAKCTTRAAVAVGVHRADRYATRSCDVTRRVLS
jgi:hypothetical protein